MSKTTYQPVGDAMTKREAIIAMLSNPGTKVASSKWPPFAFLLLSGDQVVNQDGYEVDILHNGFDLPWYILEEVTASPAKTALRRVIEEEVGRLIEAEHARIAEAETKIVESKTKIEEYKAALEKLL